MRQSSTKISTRLVAVFLCGTLCGVSVAYAQPVPPPVEAPAMAQVRAGDAFMQAGQYREAAQQFEAAYAIDPDLAILERLAEAYRLSGDGARAQMIYQRIAAQRGQVAPPPTYVAPPPTYVAPSPLPGAPMYSYTRPAPRPGQQMLNSGLGLFIAGYGIGIVGGAITMGAAYNLNADYSWYGAGGMLFIPIAGPFATIAYRSDYWWAVPWAVIDGGMQLAGLALTIAGAAVRASHKHHRTASLPFNLAPYSTAQGGGLLVSGRF